MEIPIDNNKVIPNQSDILSGSNMEVQNSVNMLLKIPQELFVDFEYISGRNFSSKDNRHIETVAYIFGKEDHLANQIVANGLLYPDQEGYPYHVISKGKTINFATKVVGAQQTYACLLYSWFLR